MIKLEASEPRGDLKNAYDCLLLIAVSRGKWEGVNLRQDREFHVTSASGLEDCQGSTAHSGPVHASL